MADEVGVDAIVGRLVQERHDVVKVAAYVVGGDWNLDVFGGKSRSHFAGERTFIELCFAKSDGTRADDGRWSSLADEPTMLPESIPPLRNAPSGTSLSRCRRTESNNNSCTRFTASGYVVGRTGVEGSDQ